MSHIAASPEGGKPFNGDLVVLDTVRPKILTGPWRLSAGLSWAQVRKARDMDFDDLRAEERALREQDGWEIKRAELRERIKTTMLARWAIAEVNSRTVRFVDVIQSTLSATPTFSMDTLAVEMRGFERIETVGEKTRVVPLIADFFDDPLDTPFVVRGYGFEPDEPWPFFKRDGATFVNLFSPPDWYVNANADVEEGAARPASPELLQEYLEALLPATLDRNYFIRALGYKLRHPGTESPAILLAAVDKYGTGRGTLFHSFLGRVFGGDATATITMDDILHPGSFNEWAGSPLVVLDELSAPQGSGVRDRGVRDMVGQRLRALVDPSDGTRAMIRNVKYGPKVTVRRCSILVGATNEPRILNLPPNDRRFFITENGVVPLDLQERFRAACRDPNFIRTCVAALQRHAFETEKQALSAPPMTPFKMAMIEGEKGVIEEAFDQVVADFGLLPQAIVTPEQIEFAVRLTASRMDRRHLIGDGVPMSERGRLLVGHGAAGWIKRQVTSKFLRPDVGTDAGARSAQRAGLRLKREPLAACIDGPDRQPLYVNPVHPERAKAMEVLRVYGTDAFRREVKRHLIANDAALKLALSGKSDPLG